MTILKHVSQARTFVILAAFIAFASAQGPSAQTLQALKVSDNKRFLITSGGAPFFWLGDTAWEIFHRLNREDVDKYLLDRAQKGFNVVQAVALAEFDGLGAPNEYGHRPLIENDPAKPDIKPGPQNDYWDHVDYVVQKAGTLGIFIGLLPTWGDKWNRGRGVGPEIFNPQNADTYGEWLGKRYSNVPNIIWIVGGDRPVENDQQKETIRAMARGLRRGDGGLHLITFHPRGGASSSDPFHSEDWLDFNMRQNGHGTEFNSRYQMTRSDYDRVPTKPVLDGEPIYEDHPISFRANDLGHSVASDVRRAMYWDLFSGGFGHTYGHHSVWQMARPGRQDINSPLMPWYEAINQPGAKQMQYGRWLLESRPFLTRIPDDSVIVPSKPPSAVPGAGLKRFVATRDSEGSYAMVYVPTGRKFKVRLRVISGARVKAWWYNPRDGSATSIAEFDSKEDREFLSPTPGEDMDWILVLDDAARKFPAPGS